MKKFPFFSQCYSLTKSLQALKHCARRFQKKGKFLPLTERELIRNKLLQLQETISRKDRIEASSQAKDLENLCSLLMKRTFLDKSISLISTLVIALVVAVIIRQMVFELFEIPTGSMRPTLKEQDRLLVSKTSFGINLPLTTKHLYFDPALVERNGIFIFTGADMDIKDVDTRYFYLFPGKKQYIKRLMGKPGDSLYFYGGRIYGVDAEGNDISSLLQPAKLNDIEHIPFIHFEGKVSALKSSLPGIFSPIVLYQMNEPIAKLSLNAQNQIQSQMLTPLSTQYKDYSPVTEYDELWGFENFGMTRILTKELAMQFFEEKITRIPEGLCYLEIKHHPSFHGAKLGRDEWGRLRPILGLSTSYLPLQESHIQALFDHLYTARFIVKNGFAYRYGSNIKMRNQNLYLPHLPDVPDGTYEFYYGKAYQILWGGITKQLSPSHPLLKRDLARLILFYNLGIEFDTRFAPQFKNQMLIPSRYIYYYEGDLYLLGAPVFSKDDPLLKNFIQRELELQMSLYHPFIDKGPPTTKDGHADIALIRKFGITIPPRMYLALGDNHAMSADSRDFGFVPEDNVRGAPDLIFWPPGYRWGVPVQSSYPWMNLPRAIIWGSLIIIIGGALYIHKRRKPPII